MKKILLFQNTDYHVETLLSIYQTLKLLCYDPVICLTYTKQDFGLIELIDNFNLNSIVLKDIKEKDFYKAILISADPHIENEGYLPKNYDEKIKEFKYKLIPLYHLSDYSKCFLYHKNYINNIEENSLSVNPFSLRYGLDFIYQCENVLTEFLPIKEHNGKLDFIITLRHWANNRYNLLLTRFLEKHKEATFNKQIEFTFLGQKNHEQYDLNIEPDTKTYGDIKCTNLYNVSELNFYKKINMGDFIINLFGPQHLKYISQRFSSSIGHTLAFEKPNTTYISYVLPYNYPTLTYSTDERFEKNILDMINFTNEEYKHHKNKFLKTKQYMRMHNKLVLEKKLNI